MTAKTSMDLYWASYSTHVTLTIRSLTLPERDCSSKALLSFASDVSAGVCKRRGWAIIRRSEVCVNRADRDYVLTNGRHEKAQLINLAMTATKSSHYTSLSSALSLWKQNSRDNNSPWLQRGRNFFLIAENIAPVRIFPSNHYPDSIDFLPRAIMKMGKKLQVKPKITGNLKTVHKETYIPVHVKTRHSTENDKKIHEQLETVYMRNIYSAKLYSKYEKDSHSFAWKVCICYVTHTTCTQQRLNLVQAVTVYTR